MIDTSRISDQHTIEVIDILQIAGEKLKQTMDNYVGLLSEKDSDLAVTEDVDLTKTLNSVLESISSLIKTSKVRIHADFSKLAYITFNEAYMKSVFLNLITNAIKYSRPDCLPEIHIHAENHHGVSRLTVADNGLGMDMEKVKGGIFGLHQKFHQHSDSKGIGLYLVHSHVTALGGTISVESKVNEGTKFIISFKR
jgi:signal transduction histidine kinase